MFVNKRRHSVAFMLFARDALFRHDVYSRLPTYPLFVAKRRVAGMHLAFATRMLPSRSGIHRIFGADALNANTSFQASTTFIARITSLTNCARARTAHANQRNNFQTDTRKRSYFLMVWRRRRY